MPDAAVPTSELPQFTRDAFPEDLYLAAFPDVRDAVKAGMLHSGLEHYQLSGRNEIAAGLRRNPFTAVPGALPAAPAAAAPAADLPAADLPAADLLAAPRPATPRVARPPSLDDDVSLPSLPRPPREPPTLLGPPQTAEEALFDPAVYLAVNPDVAAAILSGRVPDARQHWQRLGRDEERRGLRPSILRDAQFGDAPLAKPPTPEGFDAAGYLFANPDVRRAVGDDPVAAAAHWQDHGRIEGRLRRGVAAHAARRADPLAVFAKPFGLNVFGPFAAATGLGTAARNLVRALRAADLPFELFPFDVQTGAPRLPLAEADHRPRYRVNLILANADQMAGLLAVYPPGSFDDAYTIALWAWELAAFRPDWFECFGAVDEVWSNSAFEVEAIAAVAPVPVRKVRLPVLAQSAGREAGRAAFGVPEGHVVFLVAFDVGSTSARKNPLLAVEAFREAFGPDEPVFLLVKFHSSSLEPQVTREVSLALRGMTNVLVVAERVSEAEMALLRAAVDCYVSAHRAEGYGLNIAEFLALGRPVIATGYSGNCEFLDERTGYPIGYHLAEVGTQVGPYLPHYVWAEPDRAALIAAMRRVVAEPAEAAARAAAGAARMAELFGPAVIGHEVAARLAALGLDQASPPFLHLLGRTRSLRLPPLLVEHDPAELQAIAALGEHRPLFSVLLPGAPEASNPLTASLAAILIQTYPLWEVVALTSSAIPAADGLERLRGWDPRVRLRAAPARAGLAARLLAALEMSTGDWVVLMPPGDVVSPGTLLQLAEALTPGHPSAARLAGAPPLDALYADSHLVDAEGTVIGHAFRPEFSPDLLEAANYAGALLAIRKSTLLAVIAEAPDDRWAGGADVPAPTSPAEPDEAVCVYALLLALLRRRAAIGHVAAPLYQALAHRPPPLPALLQATLERHARLAYGEAARVEPGLRPATFRLRRPLGVRPRLALLLLAAPAGAPAEACRQLQAALAELLPEGLAGTDVRLVGDAALAALLPPEIRVIEPDAAAGYAARANLALRQARAEHVVILADIPHGAEPGWLEALLEPLQDADVGLVGGRVVGSDGQTRQGAAMLGPTGPMPLRPAAEAEADYGWLDAVTRNVSVLGAGCIAFRRSVLAELGGFAPALPAGLAVADCCVRAAASAYRIVDTPFARLHGHVAPALEPEVRWNAPERFYNPAFWQDGSYRLK